MIKTLIGLILLLVPFSLVSRFEDKRKGFFYILTFLIGFHLFLAIITQTFGVFKYLNILMVNLVLAAAILLKTDFKRVFDLKKTRIDFVLIFVLAVSFIALYSVHYNYTGKVTTSTINFLEVEHSKYPYPYFSDEWCSISFIDYSLRTGKLPLANPLWYDSAFPNLELFFHSFLSDIFLLLDIAPLLNYTLFTIFFGMLLIFLVYSLLMINHLGKIASGIASLSVLYIVNGANLPGIWTLIPIILGTICLILTCIFISLKDNKMILFSSLLTLLFYPPLFIFFPFIFIFYFLTSVEDRKSVKKLILSLSLIVLVSAILVGVFSYFITGLSLKSYILDYIGGKIFYPTFTQNAIPDFSPQKVIPLASLVLAALGIFRIVTKQRNALWLVASIAIGLVFWTIYSRVLWRFIIENERVVFVTSVFIVLASGFGINYLSSLLEKIRFVKKYHLVKLVGVAVLIGFLAFSFSYTQRDKWEQLMLYGLDGNINFPASPANNYLHPDDLVLFKDINGASFLSPPWKGLVIGVSTGNYPLETKPSTITNRHMGYGYLLSLDCNSRLQYAKLKEMKYLYSVPIDCPGFQEIGTSSEDFVLYKVI